MILAALVSSAPVQSQSTTGCTAQQRKEGNLKKLSEPTGGIATFPRKKEAFETALTEVAKRLRSSYVIGYCGESKDKLQLEVTDPEIQKKKPVLAYKRF